MENKFLIKPIGQVKVADNTFSIVLEKAFISGLTSIEGFSHLQIIWWGSYFDASQYRTRIINEKPYKKGPDKVGVFATRSPVRPNPILITTVAVLKIDRENGIICTPFFDAENGTPVLDIKPYHLSERVKDCTVPKWCEHWPKWDEESAEFDWQSEFNF